MPPCTRLTSQSPQPDVPTIPHVPTTPQPTTSCCATAPHCTYVDPLYLRRPAHARQDRSAHSAIPGGAFHHIASTGKATAAKPRQVSAAEKRRNANNDSLKADAARLAAQRTSFFHEHREYIAPFVDPKVLTSLKAAAAQAPPTPPYRPLLSQPESVVGGEMRDYQLTALDWMSDGCDWLGLCPILGDEMGLGKTLQTISVIAHLKHTLALPGAALVICPLSVRNRHAHFPPRHFP